MKTLRYIAALALPILFISSQCQDKKIFKEQTNILRGRIMENCTTPASNVEITLKGDGSLVGGSAVYVKTTTDDNGYFELSYTAKGSSYRLYAPYKVMDQIPSKPELDLGEVNLGGTVNFIIKLLVNNNYTENDTLYFSNWSYPNPPDIALKLAGPFSSGTIDTAINVPYTKMYIYIIRPLN